ncbi:MAG: hypothetical protein AMK73_02370, partial [Planctomycetes bacterium SM23_32]
MKVALAQINSTVGDVPGNARLASDAIGRAAALGAEAVVFPELTLSGYPPLDLVERPRFIEANEQALRQLAREARGIWAVVGHVAAAPAGAGKRAANAASVLRDGRVLLHRHKTLLPTYDVFDESRYFQPAEANEPFPLGGLPVGLVVCEDAWNDRCFWEHRFYDTDPVEELAEAGAALILNPSAS